MNAPVFPHQGMVHSSEETEFRPYARALGIVMDLAPGEFIFREGDAPRCMYLVLKGSIEVSKKGRKVETVHEGETVGTLSLDRRQAEDRRCASQRALRTRRPRQAGGPLDGQAMPELRLVRPGRIRFATARGECSAIGASTAATSAAYVAARALGSSFFERSLRC